MKSPRSLAYALAAIAGIGAGGCNTSGESNQEAAKIIAKAQTGLEQALDEYLRKARVDVAQIVDATAPTEAETNPYYLQKSVHAVYATADRMYELPDGFSKEELECLNASQRVVNNARVLLATTGANSAVMDDALESLALGVEHANRDNTDEALGGKNPEVARKWVNDLAAAYRARQHFISRSNMDE